VLAASDSPAGSAGATLKVGLVPTTDGVSGAIAVPTTKTCGLGYDRALGGTGITVMESENVVEPTLL
jgi:hypothetical protein